MARAKDEQAEHSTLHLSVTLTNRDGKTAYESTMALPVLPDQEGLDEVQHQAIEAWLGMQESALAVHQAVSVVLGKGRVKEPEG